MDGATEISATETLTAGVLTLPDHAPANGGKLVPIYWTCADEDSAFEFFTNDGEPLELGVGNTYIAICSHDSEITWEEVIPPETEPPTEAATEPAETAAEMVVETTYETLSLEETEDCAG